MCWSVHDSQSMNIILRSAIQSKPRNQFVTYADMLRRCATQKDLSEGRLVHLNVVKRGWERATYMGNLLVDMYSKCGSLTEAVKAFNNIEAPSVVSWTLVMMANAQNGYPLRALECFWRMHLDGTKPDLIAFVSILDICVTVRKLSIARATHACVHEFGVENNNVVGNVMINMYNTCGDLATAELVFNRMETDVISWTSMLAAYAQNGHFKEALSLFRKMELHGVKPNDVTFITILEAAAISSDLALGKLLHWRISEAGINIVAVSNCLINMYCKCGDLHSAKNVFEEMGNFRNEVSWTAMLAAYTQAGEGNDALALLNRMDLEGIKPDLVTHITAAEACAILISLPHALKVHQRIVESGCFASCSTIGSTLINMYGKCGNLRYARNVFQEMKIKDVVSWTGIIAVHAQAGEGHAALEFFRKMNLEGVRPNSSTFVSVLFAASHAGVAQDGRDYFLSIERDHDVNLTMEHFAGMIDLLARAGRLSEANELICNMPFNPDAVVWMTLMAACVMHDNMGLGNMTLKHMVELDPKNESPYMLLSNIYAAADKWDIVAKLRKLMEYRIEKARNGE